jgi:HEAT repeat protein
MMQDEIDQLALQLKSEKWQSRKRAATALAYYQHPRAVQILVATLISEPSGSVRKAVAEALIRMDTAAAAPLVAALDNNYVWDEPDIRRSIEATLIQLGIAAIEPLILALRARDWRMRDTAAEVLGQIGSDRVIDPLIAALRDESGAVRAAAAKSLGLLADTRAVEPLKASLIDDNAQVRKAVTVALANIKKVSRTP